MGILDIMKEDQVKTLTDEKNKLKRGEQNLHQIEVQIRDTNLSVKQLKFVSNKELANIIQLV